MIAVGTSKRDSWRGLVALSQSHTRYQSMSGYAAQRMRALPSHSAGSSMIACNMEHTLCCGFGAAPDCETTAVVPRKGWLRSLHFSQCVAVRAACAHDRDHPCMVADATLVSGLQLGVWLLRTRQNVCL